MFWFLLVLAIWISLVIFNSHTIVNENGKYLTRYYPFGQLLRRAFNVSIFIHHFHQSDQREYHDHPWKRSRSLIFWGGYKQFSSRLVWPPDDVQQVFKPWSINTIVEGMFHYVELLDEARGCWTLFFAGENPNQEWGFLTEHGYESANVRFHEREALSGD